VLGDDEVGAAVAAALAQQARAGVRVRLLVDAIGNLKSAHRHDALLKSAGVQTRLFVPALGFPGRGRTNLRNHRKLVVADGTRLWAGGRNIANEYFIGRVGEPPWLDLSFVAEGALAAQALALFEGDWQIARGAQGHAPGLRRALGPARSARARQRRRPAPGRLHPAPLAQWVPSGPDFHEDILHALLVSSIFHAEHRLLLATPYFVPDEGLLEALLLAAKRGLQITLIIPERSNHRLADWARARGARAGRRRRRRAPAARHAARQGGGGRRGAGPVRLGQPGQPQPVHQLRSHGRLLRPGRDRLAGQLDHRDRPARPARLGPAAQLVARHRRGAGGDGGFSALTADSKKILL
jgi:cardiolipin synthase